MKVIKFYGRTNNPKYWPFSNFYPAPFTDLDGIIWQTTEHYFQAMKFLPDVYLVDIDGKLTNHNVRDYIACQLTPALAAKEGRRRDLSLREDWESVKDNIMLEAIKFKFTQHEDLKQLLLGTGNAEIIEDSPGDYYWGCGKDGSGKNMLGKLLMALREKLKLDLEV